MGYESKIYFVKRYDFKVGKNTETYASDIIAMIDMCKMGCDYGVNNFIDMFDADTDFALRVEDYEEDIDREVMMDVTEDKYGAHLKYASDVHALRKQLKKIIMAQEENEGNVYWRFKALYKMLKAFEKYDGVYVVHYGY